MNFTKLSSITHSPSDRGDEYWVTSIVFHKTEDRDPIVIYTWSEDGREFTQFSEPTHPHIGHVIDMILDMSAVRVVLEYKGSTRCLTGKPVWVEQVPNVGMLGLASGKRVTAIDPATVVSVNTVSNICLWSRTAPRCARCGNKSVPTGNNTCPYCEKAYAIRDRRQHDH